MTAPILSRAELSRATLARQMLLERARVPTLDAVERLFALQAQLARPPFVGLWTRLDGFTRDSLIQLVTGRQVVRATLLRGTLHMLSARDFLHHRASFAPLLEGALSYVKEHLHELRMEPMLAAARSLLTERPRPFDEIRPALVEMGLPGNERAMGLAVRMLLPLVQLPSDSRWGWDAKAPFGLAESWLGAAPEAEADLPGLVRRYLAAFGPASVADAGAWSGLKGLRPVFDALRPELLVFQDEGKRELFDLPDAPRPPGDAPAPVRYLPEFDNLVLGHDDRGRFLEKEHRARVVSKNLQVAATFMVDGRVAGTWKAELKRSAGTLTLTPFAPLRKPARRALEEEGLRLLPFIDEARSYEVRFVES